MSEAAIKRACSYMERIAQADENSVLKILYAYQQKSQEEHATSGGG